MLFKKSAALFISGLLLMPFAMTAFAAGGSYVINNPYSEVNWETWKAYKGNLHTHSTISDADETMVDMIKGYYEQGFDFLAMTEHGVTGRQWNEKPYYHPLYVYQPIIGNERNWLSDEEFDRITSGTYPLISTGEARGTPMTCVPGGNELNAVTATKSHVNGFFLPGDLGSGNFGFENGYEYAVRLVEKNGGISHLNHLGDWIEGDGESEASDPDTVKFFARILKKYKTCIGMEVFNGSNNTTPYDRILWDNLLMEVIPYGRTIIGFSNSDAHDTRAIDYGFEVFMMEENNVGNIKKTMQNGAFFCVTRRVKATSKLGPAESFNAENQGLPYPMFNYIDVSGTKITVKAENYSHIQWIANGEVIFEKNVTPAEQADEVVLDLDTIEGSEDFLYVRAELLGEGGMCASQAFIIDDGTEPLKYEEKFTFEGLLDRIVFILKSMRLYVFASEIIKVIKK